MSSFSNILSSLQQQFGPTGLVILLFGLATLLGLILGASIMGMIAPSRKRRDFKTLIDERDELKATLESSKASAAHLITERDSLHAKHKNVESITSSQEERIATLSMKLTAADNLVKKHEAAQREVASLQAEQQELAKNDAAQRETEQREAEQLKAKRLENEQREAELRKAEQVKIEQREAELRKAEQVKIEQREAEQRKAEQVKIEQREAELRKAEQVKIEQREAEQRKAEQVKIEQREAEQRKTELVQIEQRDAKQRKAEQIKIEQREAEQRKAKQVEIERRAEQDIPKHRGAEQRDAQLSGFGRRKVEPSLAATASGSKAPPTLIKRVPSDKESSLSSADTGIIPDDQFIPVLPEAELTANVEAYDLSDLEELVDQDS